MPDVRRHAGAPARRVCPTCRGEGVVAESERVRIKIPEGTEDGGTIRVPGKGGAGVRGGPPGDLYVTVRVTPHPYFERQGNDIHGIVPITVKEAYAGAEIDVPTIHGTVRAKIPPGTQGRQRFRLRGKGVKDPRTGRAGDHIYTVRVMVPKTQSRPPGTRRGDAARLALRGGRAGGAAEGTVGSDCRRRGRTTAQRCHGSRGSRPRAPPA